MTTRQFSRWSLAVFFALFLAVPFPLQRASTQSAGNSAAKADIKTANGLTVVTFTLDAGRIRVNLPDDIRAGDTISGTVSPDPNGETKEERDANRDKLKKNVIIIRRSGGDQNIPVASYQAFTISLPGATPSGAVITPDPKMTQPMTPSGAVITPDPKITKPPATTPSGAVITPDPKITQPMTPSGAVITPDPKITTPPENLDSGFRPSFFDIFIQFDPPGTGSTAHATIPVRPLVQQPGMTPSGAVITPDPKITVPMTPSGAVITPDPKITPPSNIRLTSFDLPLLGQQGRPIVIGGPFDGDSSNTHFGFGPPGGTGAVGIGDFAGDRDQMGRYDLPLAESPRKAVFQSPTTFTGPSQITLKEGATETKGTYRTVGVNLSAPKTNLLKGEKTTLTVQVNGLEGLKQSVPLTLTYRGVIVMEGGPYQPLVIQPSQVSSDGRYTTTRGITGMQTGGWTATATVVTSRFDFCLQDDSKPSIVVLWNTVTGDYNFICPGCLPAGGGTKTGETTQTGGTTTTVAPTGTPGAIFPPPTGLSGTGTMTRKGCIITLTHNAPDRRIFARLDVCTDSATSTVEAPQTKTKFTITDRNIADNTCP